MLVMSLLDLITYTDFSLIKIISLLIWFSYKMHENGPYTLLPFNLCKRHILEKNKLFLTTKQKITLTANISIKSGDTQVHLPENMPFNFLNDLWSGPLT